MVDLQNRSSAAGQLAASIAHEVNNPLSGVLIYNQLIAKKITREDFSKEAILDYLSKMEHELSRSTKKEVKGVGLGLSGCYGIIQGLKGRIEVESKVGEGTTFTVCLPITQE